MQIPRATSWRARTLGLLLAGLACLLTAEGARAEQGIQCRSIPGLVRSFLQNHVQFHDLDREIQDRTLETYVRRLDPSRTLLLQSEVDAAQESLRGIFGNVEKGKCESLVALKEQMTAHHARTEQFVRELVGAEDFALDPSVTLVVDPEKRGQPETAEERDAINRALVHFQLSNYLAAGTELPKAKERLVHRYELRTRRSGELELEDLYAAFLDAFAVSLDPHSNYLSAQVLEDFRISMSLSLEGIGVALSERDGFSVAERIIPGGAADKQGDLQPKDKIIAVSQEGGEPVDIIDMPLRDAVALIRGKAGTNVGLTVLREGEKTERFQITIERAKIDLAERAAQLRFEERKVGDRELKLAVIELSSFYGDASSPSGRQCVEDVARLLREATEAGADGLVLDLSGNGGGVLEHAVRISGFFIQTGEIVRIENSRGQAQPLWDRDDSVLWSGPMVVHTSRVSASASEILAGALKDYGRAVITGDDHTFGKGTVQTVSSLPPGMGAVKVTTALFFRPGGKSTQKDGVASDVIVPSPFGRNGFGEAEQEYPLDGKTRKPFLSTSANATNGKAKRWRPVDDAVLAMLRDRSQKRIAESEDFTELSEKLAEAEQDNVLRLSEILEKQEEEKTASTDAGDEKTAGMGAAGDAAVAPPMTETELASEEPSFQVEEALNILADLVIAQDS